MILVVNAGSSSLKLDVVDPLTGGRRGAVHIERIGADARLRDGKDARPVVAADHGEALQAALEALQAEGSLDGVRAVGHRIVHGGERFTAPTLLADDVVDALADLVPLAPLHLPANLAGVSAARARWPDLPHVAVFDTAFHATLPRRARELPLPPEVRAAHGLRRYGFHGPSHAYVARTAAEHLGEDWRDLRIVTLHLGSGCSATAVENGRSVETTMGLSTIDGLVMRTRPGQLDPGVLLKLLRDGVSVDALDRLLHDASGLAGLAGGDGDMRDIEARAAEGDADARLALAVFTHRVRQAIGALAAVMGGVDLIVFTAGIGEHSATVRERCAARLEFLGARLDTDRNRDADVSREAPVAEISTPHSRVRILVVATDEAHQIARDAAALAAHRHDVSTPAPIPIAISARHVHLTPEAVAALFGPGHELTPRNPLSQPGQFACEETVDLIGPKRTIERVRVLGPVRPACQVEVSRTDEFFLGLDAPVRASGDVKGTPGITLRGPAGTLTIKEGVICAARHIHMTPEDALAYGVKDKDVVEVAVSGGTRDLIFGDVLVRVSPEFRLEMHVDTDEANAAELSPGAAGMLAATQGTAILRRRTVRYDAPAEAPAAGR